MSIAKTRRKQNRKSLDRKKVDEFNGNIYFGKIKNPLKLAGPSCRNSVTSLMLRCKPRYHNSGYIFHDL
jgi:hypothetical protein